MSNKDFQAENRFDKLIAGSLVVGATVTVGGGVTSFTGAEAVGLPIVYAGAGSMAAGMGLGVVGAIAETTTVTNQSLSGKSFSAKQAQKRSRMIDCLLNAPAENKPYTKMDRKKNDTLNKVSKNMTLELK